jgi:hypothetical protein
MISSSSCEVDAHQNDLIRSYQDHCAVVLLFFETLNIWYPFKMDIMIHNKRNLSTSLLFGSLLILGATTLMGSSTVIHVSAQNTTNSLTESEPLGVVTITVQQLKELENSMSDIRQALEQSNTTQALLNLTILEGQISVLAEET